MTVEWLHQFCIAARLQNITKAAERCYVSQSSLSRHIAELEKELNVKLVDRDNRNFLLSPAGEFFYEQLQPILTKLEETRVRTQQIGMGQTSQLRIASFCPYIPCIFDNILAFRQSYSEILCSVSYVSNLIPSALEPGDVDLGFVFSFEVPDTGDLEVQPVGWDELCVLVSSQHPLASERAVDLSALRCEHLLLLPPFRYPFLAPVVNAIMGEEESASRGNTSSEVENLETMILHTRFGDGISILPRIIAQERAAGCSLLDITDLDVSYQLCLCWKKDNQNPALRLFLDHYQASYPASALSS